MAKKTKLPVIIVGTGQHFQRNLAPAITRLEKNGTIELAATVDILERLSRDYFTSVPHIKRNAAPIHTQLKKYEEGQPLVILGHANKLHVEDAVDLLGKGYRVAIEKPYALTGRSLERLLKATDVSSCALLEYYLTMKSVPLLLGFGEIRPRSFYFEESLVKALPGLSQYARTIEKFSGSLPKILGPLKKIEIEVLEGEGDTGTVDGRGVDLVDIRSGGGMIQDLGTHALAPLLALEEHVGTVKENTITVRTARCREYMTMAKRRFAIPTARIGETYVEVTLKTSTKIDVTVRFGKYVFGDRNRRGILISGTKGEAYLDLNTCVLSVNDMPVLGIDKNYYPVVRSAIAHVQSEPLFTFNPVEPAAKAQDLIFKLQALARKHKVDTYYGSGSDPADIFSVHENNDDAKLNEEDIRPEDNYNKWLTILGNDLTKFFPPKKRVESVCPGCSSSEIESEFMKLGFIYRWCRNCFTLYVSPRPSEKELDAYYTSSKALAFYSEHVFRPTISARYEYQILPLVNWLKSIVSEYAPDAVRVLDYKPKFFSLWAEELPLPKRRISLVNPAHLVKTPKGAKIVQLTERSRKTYELITAIDILDHVSDPDLTVKKFSELCEPGGILFLTLNTGSSFEYQVLSRDAHRLVPPDRLNLLTIEAVESILARNGFELLDLATPGKLDVEIVLKAFLEDPSVPVSRFVSYLLKKRGATTWDSLQDFLQLNNLSSFLRIAARKK